MLCPSLPANPLPPLSLSLSLSLSVSLSRSRISRSQLVGISDFGHTWPRSLT